MNLWDSFVRTAFSNRLPHLYAVRFCDHISINLLVTEWCFRFPMFVSSVLKLQTCAGFLVTMLTQSGPESFHSIISHAVRVLKRVPVWPMISWCSLYREAAYRHTCKQVSPEPTRCIAMLGRNRMTRQSLGLVQYLSSFNLTNSQLNLVLTRGRHTSTTKALRMKN